MRLRMTQEALSLVNRKPWNLSVNDALAIGDPVKIGFRFRLVGALSGERSRGYLSVTFPLNHYGKRPLHRV
jgi:hypothetical protein